MNPVYQCRACPANTYRRMRLDRTLLYYCAGCSAVFLDPEAWRYSETPKATFHSWEPPEEKTWHDKLEPTQIERKV